MDLEILTELKKINTQLSHLISILGSTDTTKRHQIMPDIASDVQRRIDEARRKAQAKIEGISL